MSRINDEYDIGSAFQAIENELISSMMRNMSRHRAEEEKEELQWSMWQAMQLESLEKYKKENSRKYSKQFRSINKQIDTIIRRANEDGYMDQETAILEAIKNGFQTVRKSAGGATGEFFKLNEQKLDALIQAATNDMQKAETAILRQANDQYRKAIYNAQVYANTGAGTYEKAVDMATKDMLSAGLKCVEYKNGTRHTLADYADMAIRTASKRAYLQGEGTKRQEWGVYTVIVNKRGNPCPKCLPHCGKVYIDDVWSGGPKDGKSPLTGKTYPLMSSAIAGGLYHPRCKDSHTTYFEGISTPPDGKYSKEELALIEKENRQEAQEQYVERQVEKYDRLAKYSLDEENQKKYAARRDEWENQVGKYADSDIETVVSNEESPTAISSFTPAETLEEAQDYAGQFLQKEFMDKTFKGIADYKGLTLENANAINKALTNIYESVDIEKISGLKVVSPTSKIGKKAFKDGADAIASYDPIQHGIYLNKNVLGSKKKFEEYIKRSDDAWDIVMANRNSLTGAQKELADKYAEAGRSLVDGKTVEGVITHEMGHHVQWNVLDAKTSNSLGSRMSEYAPKISGYANASKGEYIAESFTAYINGEKDILDSEFVQFLDGKTLAKASDSSIIKLSDNELGALMQYKSSESYKINDALRRFDNIADLSEMEQKFIKELDNALEKTPTYEGDLCRTVNFSDYPNANERTSQFVDGFVVGKKNTIKQYWSTSKRSGYDENANIRIYIQGAKKGKDISKIGLDESEVLYERNAKFETVDKVEQNGVWYILLREA